MQDIDLSLNIMGKQLNYPLIINAVTGGTAQARSINQAFAAIAGKYGFAMAVGSQAIAIHDPGLRDTFSVVRDINPDGLIIANIGANTEWEKVLEAIEMISADAIQLHFNVPQELSMPEGDRDFSGIISNIRQVCANSPVPVIAKEVGFGFSRDSVEKLYDAGINIFDNGGKGGTNFVVIEDMRNGLFRGELDEWGIATAASLAEILALKLPVKTIASGGIRTALDVAKAICMGADMVGIAGFFLKILLNHGIDELDKRIEDLLYRLKAVFLMTGSQNIQAIQKQPMVILGDTAEWLKARGIDATIWSSR